MQVSLKVTDHALLRYLKRTGGDVSRRNKVRGIVAFGQQVKPKSDIAELRKILDHKRKAKYYLRGAWLAVVVDDTVVTVYETRPEWWKQA